MILEGGGLKTVGGEMVDEKVCAEGEQALAESEPGIIGADGVWDLSNNGAVVHLGVELEEGGAGGSQAV